MTTDWVRPPKSGTNGGFLGNEPPTHPSPYSKSQPNHNLDSILNLREEGVGS